MLQVFPDKPEKRRAAERFKAAFDSVEIQLSVFSVFYMNLLRYLTLDA